MTSKVYPCVTMMICVAGCSTTSTEQMPYARDLPPPTQGKSGTDAADPQSARNKPLERPEHLRADKLAPKPITVEVPMAVLEDVPPPAPVMRTKFEPVTDAYIAQLPEDARLVKDKPFFTPLKEPAAVAPPPAEAAPIKTAETIMKPLVEPAPVKTAKAILEPLIEPTAPDVVTVPEPIAYPRYVSVGPEYFGPDSDIAPYVISRSSTAPVPLQRTYAAAPAPTTVVPERARVAGAPAAPLPRVRPNQNGPDQPPEPSPDTQIAAIVPPRPDPEPRRIPADPNPRVPSRTQPDRIAAPSLRDETLDTVASGWEARVQSAPPKAPGWKGIVEKPLAPPPAVQDIAPPSPTYRVRVTPPDEPMTEVASLDPAPIITEQQAPQLVIVRDGTEPLATAFIPMPREKPAQPGVQISGTTAGVSSQPLDAIVKQAANDPKSGNTCHVNRGSNDRMILVCEGVNISQAQVFRAVVEGESAFRGLRDFDETDAIIASYGFNTDRFAAMSQGPRSARDLAFLRALRKSGRQIRVKGRPFDLYLMKGDNNLATVLIEQVAVVDAPTAIKLH